MPVLIPECPNNMIQCGPEDPVAFPDYSYCYSETSIGCPLNGIQMMQGIVTSIPGYFAPVMTTTTNSNNGSST